MLYAAIFIINLLGKFAPDSMNMPGARDLVSACLRCLEEKIDSIPAGQIAFMLDNLAKIDNPEEGPSESFLRAYLEKPGRPLPIQLVGAIETACKLPNHQELVPLYLEKFSSHLVVPLPYIKRTVSALV